MTKYSGFFLSILLVVFCLWINLWRYPAVWVMLNGQSPAVPSASSEENSPDYQGPAEPISVQNDSFSPFTTEGNAEGEPVSRAPTPVVVPVSRPKDHNPDQERSEYFRPATLSRPSDNSGDSPSDESGQAKAESETKEADTVQYPAAGSPGTMKLSEENPAYAETEYL